MVDLRFFCVLYTNRVQDELNYARTVRNTERTLGTGIQA